jgi:hypothetical protein
MHCRGDWAICWLLTDYDAARAHIVAGQGGGTYYLEDGSTGWYETTAKGMTVTTGIMRGDVITFLPWSEIRAWCKAQTTATVDRAAELRAELQQIQGLYPPIYPGIGHGYAWDRKDATDATDAEIEADRVLLAEAQAKNAVLHNEHNAKMRAHNATVREFVLSLGPDDEPADLLDEHSHRHEPECTTADDCHEFQLADAILGAAS